jgi:branched-chain amino acid transport system substrate-binding protein
MNGITRRDAILGTGLGGLMLPRVLNAQPAQRPTELRIGITTFLSGPASVFGVPGRQAAEMLIEEINRAGGIGGVPIRPFFVDEGPGIEHLLGEFRRLVQNERVEVMLASISSGSCLACTPLAEELKRVTLLWDCGPSASSRSGATNTPSAPRRMRPPRSCRRCSTCSSASRISAPSPC